MTVSFMPNTPFYGQSHSKSSFWLNQWDGIVLLLLFGVLAALVYGMQHMTAPFSLGETIPISLDPWMLPSYAAHTVVRMFIALILSLLFTFTIGTLAAKSARAERFIIPFIDIMQSVPILGFLSITILGFVYLFPNSLLGPECAAIFVIFTSQVWNMALSFYQSLRTVPKDLHEVTHVFQLTKWQRFWRLEVPFATPALIWNTMMSLSAGWFFVVASEAILVNGHEITLPGIGSYIWVAIIQSDYQAIGYVIFTMFLVILIYDQLLFRPLIAWSDKFKPEVSLDESPSSWFLTLLQRARITHYLFRLLRFLRDVFTRPWFIRNHRRPNLPPRVKQALSWTAIAFWNGLLLFGILGALLTFGWFIYKEITFLEIVTVFYLGFVTAFKVMVLIVISSIIWVPIGVYIGLKPRWVPIFQPISQFLAAFPANLLYPLVFMLIFTYHLNVNIWTAPLMILGTQWYIVFNVIAGASSLPQELQWVTKNYGVKGWLWWRKVILPGIFPYYVTGAMTAAGGCWNASIVSDVVTWGGETVVALGLGGYITQYTRVGDFPRIGLGIAVMALYVIVINRLLWRKLQLFAEERYNASIT